MNNIAKALVGMPDQANIALVYDWIVNEWCVTVDGSHAADLFNTVTVHQGKYPDASLAELIKIAFEKFTHRPKGLSDD